MSVPLLCSCRNVSRLSRSLGLSLAHRPGDAAAGRHLEIATQHDVGQHPRPDLGDVVVDHRQLEDAGVDHLQQIVLLQNLVHLFDIDRLVALFAQAITERTQTTDKAAAPDRIDGASS